MRLASWQRAVGRSPPGRLAVVVLLFGLALLLSRGVFWLADSVVEVGDPGTVSRLLAGVLALQVVGFGSVVALVVWYRKESWRSLLRLGGVTEWVVFYGAAVGLALMLVASLATGLFTLIDLESAESAVGAAEDPQFYAVLFVVSTFVVVPLEEAFFRGFVQARLEEQFHSAIAIGVASLCFVVVHTGITVGAGGELLAFGLFFALSVVLGVSYAVTENLLVPIIGHALFNGSQILVRTLELLL